MLNDQYEVMDIYLVLSDSQNVNALEKALQKAMTYDVMDFAPNAKINKVEVLRRERESDFFFFFFSDLLL